MLAELHIENLGVIERLDLCFGAGFTAFTGETGAGKTMLVEAMSLLVGGRADGAMVRPGTDEARVDGRFIVPGPDGDDEVILSRVIPADGRSRAYVDGRLATVAQLQEIGSRIVDIHGQHAHQRLLTASTQRAALDHFGKIDLGDLQKAREDIARIDASLAELGGDERSRAREIDLLRFQLSEIESAALVDGGEDLRLSSEEDLLSRATAFREALSGAYDLIADDNGVRDTLGRASALLGGTTSGSHFADIAGRIEALLAEVDDVAAELRRGAETVEEDPERLQVIRLRRQLLLDLRRKYGESLTDVISFASDVRRRLEDLESHSSRVAELTAARAAAAEAFVKAATIVGRARREAAPRLAHDIQSRLRLLALPHAEVEVAVGGDETSDAVDAGSDITYLISTNPGSPLAPLTKVASGGELARTMLAVRLVLSDDPSTMVFDEVDAGIGGAAALAVAQALGELGTQHQVFAVTHLAQVAAAASTHVVVSKEVIDRATYGRAEIAAGDDRIAEIARMLSGGVADDSARRHATDLLAELGAGMNSPSTRHGRGAKGSTQPRKAGPRRKAG
jgi:DNA repair protein RecN (Recombination protein N)